MKNKKEKRRLAIYILCGLQAKRIEDWLKSVGTFLHIVKHEDNEPEPYMNNTITQVYDGKEDNHLIDSMPVAEEKSCIQGFDLMPDELKVQYEQDLTRVCALFNNELFMNAYLEDNNDLMLSIIETFYYDGQMDYALLSELVRNKVVTLSEENIAHFKKIGLIPTFNNGDNGNSLS